MVRKLMIKENIKVKSKLANIIFNDVKNSISKKIKSLGYDLLDVIELDKDVTRNTSNSSDCYIKFDFKSTATSESFETTYDVLTDIVDRLDLKYSKYWYNDYESRLYITWEFETYENNNMKPVYGSSQQWYDSDCYSLLIWIYGLYDVDEEFESDTDDEPIRDISNKHEAYRWLQDKIDEYGDVSYFPYNDRLKLNKLIDRFGNTYFWR